MYISKIHIQNYRNYKDFTMEFNKGLNVIIGANNSGKTGLLKAINLLNEPSICLDDFNKNNLIKCFELYNETAPSIVIEYYISHKIYEDDTSDESIIRLLPFLGIKEFKENRKKVDDRIEYNIVAKVKAVYELNAKYLDEYKKKIRGLKNFDDYLIVLNYFLQYYDWTYTNGISDTKIDHKLATGIFDIQVIGAERTCDEVRKQAKREIELLVKDFERSLIFDDFNKKVSQNLIQLLNESSINKLCNLFENEENEIGLQTGNISIHSKVITNLSIPDAYITEVEDTVNKFTLPLKYNGLGYNNLINIYMLIKLTEFQIGSNFKILCLEEPEAHLHPAMQYKLFKYLRKLDNKNALNQQMFITTHSNNISAVAGMDNMFMLSYDRDKSECLQQSLEKQFKDEQGKIEKINAKKHLTKFLDVTRSDMLFADKVVLVEGIAEKLLMPLFMENCGCSYEDEHISIVEIGGKHFEHFVELFNGNSVKKKVLCITDKDFRWINQCGELKAFSEYKAQNPEHIEKLKNRFQIDNFNIFTQSLGGRTFEDELFLENTKNLYISELLFKKVLSNSMNEIFNLCKFNISKWQKNKDKIDRKSVNTIEKYLYAYESRVDKNGKSCNYEKLIFAEIFLHYAENKKGDLALQILTDEELFDKLGKTKIIVPNYIREGLKWLLN